MLNYSFIFKKAKISQIDNITIEREYWQLLWLQKIYSLPLSDKIYFKGGTAIRFIFQSFRFSEDLDFTSTLTEKECNKIINETFTVLKKNDNSNIEIKKEKVHKRFDDVSFKYKFMFLPRNISQKVSIRIDISLREKPLTKDESVLVPFDYPISPYPLVVHLSAKEMLAEKVRALFVRQQPRDLFDLYFLLTKKIELNKKMITKKFKLYPKIIYSLEKLKKVVEKYDEKELKNDLNQFLPLQYRNFYKKLKQEVVKLINI